MSTVMAQTALTYAFQAFPNAPAAFLRQILSNYTGEIVLSLGLGITALWEYIYDRLFEYDPKIIATTAAYKRIPEGTPAEVVERLKENPPNGYSEPDKEVINEILHNATDDRPKELLKIYSKSGTLEDAKKEFKKLNGGDDGEEKKPNVWVKTLSNGKTAIVRKASTDEDAKATIEVQTVIDGTKYPVIKIRYK